MRNAEQKEAKTVDVFCAFAETNDLGFDVVLRENGSSIIILKCDEWMEDFVQERMLEIIEELQESD